MCLGVKIEVYQCDVKKSLSFYYYYYYYMWVLYIKWLILKKIKNC
jgi:hypothetical protein